MRSLKRFECMIEYDGDELGVKAVIQPTVHAPHVGADSPRFMRPGRPAEVLAYSLFNDDGEDVTINYYMERDREAIKKLILEAWKIDQTADAIYDEFFSPTLAEVNFRRGC
jgi:hypothetical protein